MSATLTRHRFTVEEYNELIGFGVLGENQRVEFIRGEVIDKMPIGELHLFCVNQLNRILNRQVGDDVIVSVQNPIRLEDSEPEPDVALLRPRDDSYRSAKPQGKDALLVIEVADTSLEIDRDIKCSLYAEAGIPEYWIVNLLDGCVEVHRHPQPDGTYRQIQVLRDGQTVRVEALPNCTVEVSQLV